MSIFAIPLEFFFGQETYVCSRLSTLHHDAESLELLTTAHASHLLRDLSFLGEHRIIARICHFADLHVASDMPSHDRDAIESLINAFAGPFRHYAIYRRRKLPTPSSPGIARAAPLAQHAQDDEDEEHWIEVCIVDVQDVPLPHVQCEIELPGGRVCKRTSNLHGVIRVDGVRHRGQCRIHVPVQKVTTTRT